MVLIESYFGFKNKNLVILITVYNISLIIGVNLDRFYNVFLVFSTSCIGDNNIELCRSISINDNNGLKSNCCRLCLAVCVCVPVCFKIESTNCRL